MSEFQVHDVVRHRETGLLGVVTAIRPPSANGQACELSMGKHWSQHARDCELAYRAKPEALALFEKPESRAFMGRLSKNAWFHMSFNETDPRMAVWSESRSLSMVEGSPWIDWGGEQDLDEQLATGRLYPQSAKRYLEQQPQVTTVTTAKQYQGLFGKPAPVGMFGEMTGSVIGIGNPTQPGSAFQQLCRNLSKMTERHFRMGETVLIKHGIFPAGHWANGKTGTVSDLLDGGTHAYVSIPGEKWTALVGVDHVEFEEPLIRWGADTAPMPEFALQVPLPAVSNNCASCGDALHETYDPSRVVDGQRHHGTCADRVERLRAESAPKVEKPDPYTAHRLGLTSEDAITEATRVFGAVQGVRFSADQEPEYQEHITHPWTCDDDL